MSWLKKHILPHLVSKNWPIRIKRNTGWVFVEVTDHFSSIWAERQPLYIDLLEVVFHNYETVSLSQKVDLLQWKVGSCDQFANKIREDFSINVELSTDYASPNNPGTADREFVIHSISPFNRALWQESAGFGMFNLPNIAYGFREIPEGWPANIFELNKQVISWFNFEVSDEQFTKLLEGIDLLFLTIDGHLCFWFTNDEEANDFLREINTIGEKASLVPVIEQAQT